MEQQLTKSTADPQNLDLLHFRKPTKSNQRKIVLFEQCATAHVKPKIVKPVLPDIFVAIWNEGLKAQN